ncbi:ATP-dependent Clp protease proteolytic subunit-related protein 2, chloroplastic-like isoform X2 [Zingiber officinale]|uniref:ATP-dependent Clp protease proteolytic subunit-related protein 2, chloroplastic-like isoform X2 n=1 Tax=Zingiber officinale TaxID=94328 RepID=UPI001C4D7E93|nr:ATP-dependent Clp protease proteolytic subunit-related protein 2, chloroplastic-like isoform X2 [Zingiber officinale]
MAVSLQSAYCRPVALDHRHSPSLTFKSFAGPKSGTFRRGPSNVNAEFYSRVNQSISLRYSAKKGSRGRVFMMPIGIPRVPYRTPGEGTWQWVDLWNALYRERVVFIGEHIDEEYSNQVLATMLYLDSIESSKKIYLYINGPGGDLTPSMSIYDTMQSLQSPVATHCVGYAYDMAAYILAAGEKGNRSGMPLCEIALQTPAGVARGQADDVQNEANELLRIRDYLFSELSKKTGQPLERISKDLVYVARFTAQEALEYGLIDCIIRPSRIKPDAPRKETPGIGRG